MKRSFSKFHPLYKVGNNFYEIRKLSIFRPLHLKRTLLRALKPCRCVGFDKVEFYFFPPFFTPMVNLLLKSFKLGLHCNENISVTGCAWSQSNGWIDQGDRRPTGCTMQRPHY
jgi:hypothetical protein